MSRVGLPHQLALPYTILIYQLTWTECEDLALLLLSLEMSFYGVLILDDSHTRLFQCIVTESQAILMPSTYRRTTSYIIYTQKSSGSLAHTKESAAAIQKWQIIHVGGCPAHTLKHKSYETNAIITHKHLPNKQWRTNSYHGCKGEQATGNLFSLFLYQMFCRFVQTKDDFSLKINYHLLQKEVSKILLFSK